MEYLKDHRDLEKCGISQSPQGSCKMLNDTRKDVEYMPKRHNPHLNMLITNIQSQI